MTVGVEPQQRREKKKSSQREWAPRFWNGMNLGGWMRLLVRNRFRVGWQYWYIALCISGASVFHTVWRAWQMLFLGRKIARTPIEHAPIFIVGHWRSGTTLLHELLVLDEQFTYPTTFACLAPNHFLISEPFAARWLNFLLPSRRPMDNMAAGWDKPQEEEFALCNLGVPSPYLTVAFPNHGPQYQEYLTLRDVPADDLASWKRTFLQFLREITYRTPKAIVLKSPPHTARIHALREMFPQAKFIHIVRDPNVVFASTVNLWRTLYTKHGLQKPNFAGIEEYVLDTFAEMYGQYEQDRTTIPEGYLHEVHYEDLVRDPINQMREVYNKLGLAGFDEVLPKLEHYFDQHQGYSTNRYQISDENRELIQQRWAPFIERYGYGNKS